MRFRCIIPGSGEKAKSRRNRGAAIVSVMIGVMFMTILASSLVYMALMNFNMKAMRYYATDNFYSAEFALDDLTAQICQLVKDSKDPLKDLEDLKKTVSVSGGNFDVFDVDKLEAMIQVADKMNQLESVKVDCIYRSSSGSYTQNTFVKSGGRVSFLGVQITTLTKPEYGSYSSTITTDIEFYFPQQSDGDFDVNDFSVLSDTSFSVEAVPQCFSGCMYLKQSSEGYALKIGSQGLVYALGRFNYMDGDVIINDGVLFVSGDMYIDGDLKMNTKGMLYVTGHLYIRGSMSGGINQSEDGHVFADNKEVTADGKGKVTGVNWKYYDDNYNDGLAHRVYADTMSIQTGSSEPFTLTTYPIREYLGYLGDHGATGGESTVNFGGSLGEIHSYFYQPEASGGYNYVNSLIFGRGHVKIQTNLRYDNCTYVNMGGSGNIEVTTGSNMNYWGTMTDEAYEAAKSIFFSGKISTVNHAGKQLDFSCTTSDVYSSKDLQDKYGISEATGVYRIYKHGDKPDDASPTYERVMPYTTKFGSTVYRSYPYKNIGDTHYYVSGETLIHPQSKAILSNFASGSSGSNFDAHPVITYANWTKE